MVKQLVIAAVLVLGACKKDKDGHKVEPSMDKTDQSMVELTALRDKMCACSDKACAESVNKEVDAFFKRDRARFDAMSEAEKQQSRKLEDTQYECWKKLTGH